MLGPASLSHASNTIVDFARSLQLTGSDFIMEEDLSALFVRFNIHADFLEEFKDRTIANTKISKISDFVPVGLQAGPGPSVRRALRDANYTALITHLSMFAATHEIDSFSEGLAEILATRSERNGQQSFPLSRNIKSVMSACAEQTAGYKWHYLTDTIMRTLGLPNSILRPRQRCPSAHRPRNPTNAVDRYFSLSWAQLNASLDILLAVQRIYSDHVMVRYLKG